MTSTRLSTLSYWWKRRSRSKFAPSHYAWGTNGVCECKMVALNQGHGSMYRSWSFFFEINGWAGEKGVVPCAHPSHPRIGTPHESRFHILCCARMGAEEPVVQTVTKGHVPVRKLRELHRPVTLGMKYEKLVMMTFIVGHLH